MVVFYAPRAGGAYDSHYRTAGIAGRTRRRGGCVAARGAGAAAGQDPRASDTSEREPRTTIKFARNSCAGCATSVMSKGAILPTSFATMAMISTRYLR